MAIYLQRYLRGDSLTTIGKVFDIQSYSTVGSIIHCYYQRIQLVFELVEFHGIVRFTRFYGLTLCPIYEAGRLVMMKINFLYVCGAQTALI
jgi:hypothetical protein